MATITSTITHGITLSTTGSYASPLTIATYGAVETSDTAISGPNTQPWTVANYGSIEGTPNYGVGIRLGDGGSVANSGTDARIDGHYGVYIVNGSGTVSNAGTITGTSGIGFAVALYEGGTVANIGSAALISGGHDGVLVIGAAGTVSNAGTIEATETTGTSIGVYFVGAFANTLTNSGIIAGDNGADAVRFGSGDDSLIVDPGAVFTGNVDGGGVGNTMELASTASTGTIAGLGTSFVNFATITVDPGAQWTVTGSNTVGSGVTLGDYGTLTNSGTLTGAGSLVVDPTTMTNTGYVGIAITLEDGSYLDNTATGTISVAGTAVLGTGAPAGVYNAGTITGTGIGGTAVYLDDGGSVTNSGTAGSILGVAAGIRITGSIGTVTNYREIAATGGTGVYLVAGGVVNNGNGTATQATISGTDAGVQIGNNTYPTSGTVANYGTIESTGSTGLGYGIELTSYGTVTNAASALIEGYYRGILAGLYSASPGSTITNYGTIETTGTVGEGISLSSGGTVDNGSALSPGATIDGARYGVFSLADSAEVNNFGTIRGGNAGVQLSGSYPNVTTVTNGGPTSHTAAITGARGVYLYSGSLTNFGLIDGTGTGGLGLPTYFGVELDEAGVVTNYGTIEGEGTATNAILLESGGAVINGPSGATAALISGDDNGIYVDHGGGTVTNYGDITGTSGAGIYFTPGHSYSDIVTNAGTIAGGSGQDAIKFGDGNNALYIDPGAVFTGTVDGGLGGDNTIYLAPGTAPGTIGGIGTSFINFGTVVVEAGATWTTTGDNTLPITVDAGGYLDNAGTISAGTVAVYVGSYATVRNAGTIAGTTASGAYAVQFTGIGNLLIVDPGAVFTGTVGGSSSEYNTLELASAATTGTITGLGTNYIGFDNVTVDAGARWELTGSAAPAVTVYSGAYLENTGTMGGPFVGTGGTVDIVNAGTVDFAGGLGAAFYLQEGGTLTNSGTAAYIYGSTYGVNVNGAAGTVTNDGTIYGAGIGDGVHLQQGGSVANTGTRSSDNNGTITAGVYGTISGGIYGVRVDGAAGTVTNYGKIYGGTTGVYLAAGGTVMNAGAISGNSGYSVLFGGTDNLLIVDPGAAFYGVVQGGTGSNTLELASASGIGTISGIGSNYYPNFQNFGTVTVDAGAQWALYNGVTASSFTNNGTLTGATSLTIDPGTMVNNGYVGLPVALSADSYLYNAPTGTIKVAYNYNAVTGHGTGIGIVNAGTITSANEDAVYFYGDGNVTNANATAQITGYLGVLIDGQGTVSNSGTITGTGIHAVGVAVAYGSVANTGSSAYISGAYDGVSFYGPGSVTNSGTIIGTYRDGISIGYGAYTTYGATIGPGSVDNTGGTALISGGHDGVYIYGPGSVTNSGTIIGTQEDGVSIGYGAYATYGSILGYGTVDNTGTGLISGNHEGVYIYGAGTVTNSGTIIGTYHIGVDIGTGTVTNLVATAQITGYLGVLIDGQGTLTNYGTITGTGTAGAAVRYGSVANTGSAAQISGAYDGVVFYTPGSVTNSGTIIGTYGSGIGIGYGGPDTNGTAFGAGSVDNIGGTALISGAYDGIYILGPGSVANSGTIMGAHYDGVSIGYAAGPTDGAILGYGSVGNTGGTALISGYRDGVFIYGPGTVTNSGTIIGTYNDGVEIGSGTVANLSGATISGYGNGVFVYGDGTVTNYGTIAASAGVGINLDGGSVANHGSVGGGAFGIVMVGDGDVYNAGLVTGGGFGVGVRGGSGTVTNVGTIEGTTPGTTGFGVYFAGNHHDTLINSGTISGAAGSDAVLFRNSEDWLVDDPGAVFNGDVRGGGGTLELASAAGAGTITGVGASYFDFNTILVDTGANWTLAGSNTIGSGVSLTDAGRVTLQTGAYLYNDGAISITGGSAMGAGAGVTVVNAATIASTGGNALNFSAASDVLVFDPGAVFAGTVGGGGGTLDLASAASSGTISGLGTSFADFGTIAVAAGANWTLAGVNTIGSGVTITDLGTLTNTGSLGGSGVLIVDPATVINTSYLGVTTTLQSGSYLDNTSTGTISVAAGNAVYGSGGVTVVNAGTIASGGDAVKFSGAGNLLVDDPGAVFTGTVVGGGGALELASAASAGTIAGFGTSFTAFGTITVDAGAGWTISGANTIGTGVTLTDHGTLTNTGSLGGSGVLAVDAGTLVNSGNLGLTATLQSGSYLDNTGTISVASGNAVSGTGGVTVVNAGTIASSGGAALLFSGADNLLVADPGAVFSGTVDGGGGALELASAASTGTISGLGASFVDFSTITVGSGARWVLSGANAVGTGVTLTDRGALTNTGGLTGSGVLTLAPGTLINSGYLGLAATLQSGSYLDNTGTISVASGNAVYGSGGVTVVNAGRIASAGGDAVKFSGAGNVLVADPGAAFGGLVDGGGGTLELGSAAGTGTISGLGTGFVDFSAITVEPGANWVLSGANTIGSGVTLTDLGTLTNTGSLTGAGTLTVDPATFVNSGYLGLTATLQSGSYLDNTGTISVASGNAVYATGGAIVVNAGTIAGGGGDAVKFSGAGNVLVVDPGAVFGGLVDGGGGALELGSAASTGTISGLGTGFVDFAAVTVEPGADWSFSGANATGNGVTLTHLGVLTNTGTLSAASGNAVYGTGGGVTVVNAGTIASSGGDAVKFSGTGNVLVVDPGAVFTGTVDGGGGTLDLASAARTGTISGLGTRYVNFSAITIEPGADWTLAGANTIGAGVTLTDLGALTNAGSSSGAGLLTINPGTLTNGGYLGLGATLQSGSYLDNTGTISVASGNAVYGRGVTVVNSGTIASSSGDTVKFSGTGNLLVADPGAVFIGTVDGGGGTLDLASAAGTGTIGGLGTEFANFAAITVEAGANWALSGTNTIGNGVTLTDLGVLTNTGSVTGSGALTLAPGVLINSGYLGLTATLQSGSYLDNTGTISVASGNAVYGRGGVTVVNAGAIAGSGGDAVKLSGAGNVLLVDPGAVFGGLVDGGGGTLELGSAAGIGTISGLGTEFVNFSAITVEAGANWALSAANTISNGVTLTDLGVLTNTGNLSGPGLLTVGLGSLINSGYLGLAPTLENGGYLDNAGTISVASGNAVYGSGGVTVVNAGTIASAGGDAVKLSGANNLLVVDPGAVFGGQVDGGGGRLELGSAASTGTINGLGTSFVDFSAITVAAGADWQLAGTIANGTTLTVQSGAVVAGTIDLAGAGSSVVVDGPDVAASPALALGATIDGFLPGAGNTIGLGGVSAGSISPARLMPGNILNVGANGNAYQFQLDPAQSYAGDYFVESYDGGSGILDISVVTAPIPNDFTGNGQSDLLMTDDNTGALVIGEVSGSTVNYTQIGGLGPEWQFEGTGSSLLGDGKQGFLLWNSTPNDGTMVIGENAGGTAQYTAIGGVGPEWQFEGNGPLLGQANDDFLLWDPNSATPEYGALVVGSVVGGAAQYTQIGGVGPEWQFEGVGDYLGDGSSSFLMWDGSAASSQFGSLVVGDVVNGAANYIRVGGLGPEWQFKGTGDLLGDGQDDFLIWDSNSSDPIGYGALFVGEVVGGQAQYTKIGSVGPEWQFLGIGNYDGASNAEFMMRNGNTGALVIGTVANGTATYAAVGNVGPEWNFHTSNPATLV